MISLVKFPRPPPFSHMYFAGKYRHQQVYTSKFIPANIYTGGEDSRYPIACWRISQSQDETPLLVSQVTWKSIDLFLWATRFELKFFHLVVHTRFELNIFLCNR